MNDTKETKSCSKCKEVKPLEKFAVYKGKPFCWCKPCQVVSSTSYRKRNPEKSRLIQSKYRDKNREKLNSDQREKRKANPEKTRLQNHQNWIRNKEKIMATHRKRWMKSYGITVSKYEEMLTSQGGVCAICSGNSDSNRRLSVDHDHKTGEVRGLLCNRCNLSIGKFEDDKTLLLNAIKYLEDSNV